MTSKIEFKNGRQPFIDKLSGEYLLNIPIECQEMNSHDKCVSFELKGRNDTFKCLFSNFDKS